MGRTQLATRVAELHRSLHEAEKNRQNILSKIHELKNACLNKQITYQEYETHLAVKHSGKTWTEWVEYYDAYIALCRRHIEHLHKSHTRKKYTKYFLFFISAILVVFLLRSNLTGFIISGGEEGNYSTYTEDLNHFFEESSSIDWEQSNPGQIVAAKFSGTIYGKGSAKIYLDDVLIATISPQEKEISAFKGLTGFVVGDEISNTGQEDSVSDSIDTSSPTSQSEESESPSHTGSQTPDNPQEQSEEPASDQVSDSESSTQPSQSQQQPEEDQQSSPSHTPQAAETNSTEEKIDENETLLPVEEPVINDSQSPYSDNESSQEEPTPIQEDEGYKFSLICNEACDLSQYGILNSQHTIRVELEDANVSLDSISYMIPIIEPEADNSTIISENLSLESPIVIEEPVHWRKEVNLDQPGTVTVDVPVEAKSISVNSLDDESTQDIQVNEIKDKDADNTKQIEVNGDADSYEVLYETQAPQVKENVISDTQKEVTISAPDELNYTNVVSFTDLPQQLPWYEVNKIHLYWEVNGTNVEHPFTANDTNNDSLVDRLEWVTPHLSTQKFIIIIVTKAEHLNENKEFISDIYEDVREKDGNWSEEIPDNHYVRVVFEKLLTKENDITLYPRVISGNPRIEVYVKDGNESIANFTSLESDSYNKILLTNLIGVEDTFDLHVINGSVEFDHIVDPSYFTDVQVQRGALAMSTISANITISPVNLSESFVLISVRSGSSTADVNLITANLTNSTNIKLDRYTNTAATVEWQVVSGSGFNVKRNESNAGTAVSTMPINITAVNTTNSFIIVTSRMNSATATQYTRGFWTAQWANASQFNITRGVTGTATVVSWQVVSWNGALVRNGTENIFTAPKLINFTNPTINLSNTFLISSIYTSSQNAINASVQARIVNTTQITFAAKGTMTTSPTRVSYFLITSSAITVKNGSNQLPSAAPVRANFTSVNMTRTLLLSSYNYNTQSTTWTNVIPTMNLTNASQAIFQKNGGTGITNVTWFAVELADVRDTPPETTLTDPDDNSNVTSATQVFNATFNDAYSNMKNATLFVWNSDSALAGKVSVTVTGGTNSTNVTFTLPYEDVFKWTYFACDSAQNCAFGSNFTITYDASAPVLNFTDPSEENNSVEKNNILNFNVSASDISAYNINYTLYGIDEPSNDTFIFNSTTIASTSPPAIRFFAVPDGYYVLNVTATDSHGNDGTITTYVKVDTTYPSMTLVQSGTLLMSATNANVTLQTPVNTSSSFVMISVRSASSTPNVNSITANLTNATQITLSRFAATAATVEWQVVSDSGLNVKRGEETTVSAATRNITRVIPSTNLSNSFIIVTSRLNSATAANTVGALFTGEFKNSTLINFTRAGAMNTVATVSWQVVSWINATVQSGSVNANFSSAIVPLTAIDTSKTFITFSSRVNNTNAINASVQATLVNPTLAAFRIFGSSVNAMPPTVSYFVVTHPSINVQSGKTLISGVASTQTANITAVNKSLTFVLNSYTYNTQSTTWSNVYTTWNLTNNTQIQFQKGGATGNNNNTWFAIQLSEATDNTNPDIDYGARTEANATVVSRNNIIINVTATDENLDNITINVYGSAMNLVNSTTSSNSPHYLNITLPNGFYQFNATAYDTAGNVNYTETRNVTVLSTDLYSCMTIAIPGTYVQKADIVPLGTCFNITASNVVFDGNGYDLVNTTLNRIIMNVSNVKNFTLKNANISSSSLTSMVGIEARNMTSSLWINNTFGMGYYMVDMINSSNNTIINNVILNAVSDVFNIEINSSDNDFINNTFRNISTGGAIWMDTGSNFTTIAGNRFYNVTTYAIKTQAGTTGNITIENNTFIGKLSTAAIVLNGDNAMIRNNNFSSISKVISIGRNNIAIINNTMYNITSSAIDSNGGYLAVQIRNNNFTNIAADAIVPGSGGMQNLTTTGNYFQNVGGLAIRADSIVTPFAFQGNTLVNVTYAVNIRDLSGSSSNVTISNNLVKYSKGFLNISDYSAQAIFSVEDNFVLNSTSSVLLLATGNRTYFRNITIENTSVNAYDIVFSGSNNVHFEDVVKISNYSIISPVQLTINDSAFGQIRFTSALDRLNRTNFSSDFVIRNNSVFVNATTNALNKSANISFYGIRNNFTNPAIVRDGRYLCDATTSPLCVNSTSLNAGSLVNFNVSSWTVNYSIGERPAAPVITRVFSIPDQSITENSRTLVLINFTASDAEGFADINAASAIVNLTRTGVSTVRSNNTCIRYQQGGLQANFSCTLDAWYFDSAGEWNISVFIGDSKFMNATNMSTNFTILQTSAFVAGPSTLSFPGIAPGAFNQTANNDPIILNNTGNRPITAGNIQINATNLRGETDNSKGIWAGNFSVGTSTGSNAECGATGSVSMSRAVFTSLPSAALSVGNNSLNDGNTGQEQLYVCIKQIGTELTAQSYSTATDGSWTIKILVVAISLRRKKKLKEDRLFKAIMLINSEPEEKQTSVNKEVVDALTSEIASKYSVSKVVVKEVIVESSEIEVPVSIFSSELGALEAISIYLKDVKNMRFRDIARAIQRNDKTIWTAYHVAKKKNLEFKKDGKTTVPLKALEREGLTIFESLVSYLKDQKAMKYSQIADQLGREQRNIWTMYNRASKKLIEGKSGIVTLE